jgi:putative flippase GtrA
MGTMFLLVTTLGMNDKIAKLIVQVIVTIGNYLFSKLLVFKDS